MNSHRSDIRNKRTEKPVPAHFCANNHQMDDVQVMVIKRLWKNVVVIRKIRES